MTQETEEGDLVDVITRADTDTSTPRITIGTTPTSSQRGLGSSDELDLPSDHFDPTTGEIDPAKFYAALSARYAIPTGSPPDLVRAVSQQDIDGADPLYARSLLGDVYLQYEDAQLEIVYSLEQAKIVSVRDATVMRDVPMSDALSIAIVVPTDMPLAEAVEIGNRIATYDQFVIRQYVTSSLDLPVRPTVRMPKGSDLSEATVSLLRTFFDEKVGLELGSLPSVVSDTGMVDIAIILPAV